MGFKSEALRFERQGAAARERVVEGRQPVAVEQFPRPRVARIRGAGPPPALPNLGPRPLQHRLVGGVLPPHQLLDDSEQTLSLQLRRHVAECRPVGPRVAEPVAESLGRSLARSVDRLAEPAAATSPFPLPDAAGPPVVPACSTRRLFSARSAARFFLGSDRSTSTYSAGSSTICAKMTARAAASGRRTHHRCSVLGCPCRIDFSRADASLMASSGKATLMSFLRVRTALTLCSSPAPRPPGSRGAARCRRASCIPAIGPRVRGSRQG